MQKRNSKRPDKGLDVAQNAKRVFDEAISRSEPTLEVITVSKSTISFVMAEMGRKGGKVGGKRRLVTMTAERRSEIAKGAALKRWGARKKIAK